MKKIIILSILSVFLFGCVAAPFISPIITGIVLWKDGEAHKYYNEESHTMYRATKIALKELNYTITKDETKKNDGYYIVADNKFKINIRQVKPHITEVSIRINIMGDKPYAELIYHQIDINSNSIDFDDQGKPTKNKRKLRGNQ